MNVRIKVLTGKNMLSKLRIKNMSAAWLIQIVGYTKDEAYFIKFMIKVGDDTLKPMSSLCKLHAGRFSWGSYSVATVEPE
jgi:hypothetical protein